MRLIDIMICSELKTICPNITLGCIQANVKVESSADSLWEEINNYCDVLKRQIHIEELEALPGINDGREAYKRLGKAPSRYRLSSEALIRRVLQGKGVYKINNIVDINNLISLKSMLPVGSYNVENLHSPISLRRGKEGEQYKGIGKDLVNINSLPVLTDSISSFGSPTSDSERAMITNNVSQILMCIYSFSVKINIEEYLQHARELLGKYANGTQIKTKIIE
ncbi:MAG: phenylalanine--tRNA ligase beta subunit-related protein [Desulfitobacterium hafniense]|nr:phenylalanine--tRNA ligase beta subunit-related protein [Desulfitobacterium hafniense]